jgi:hypothetical protein
VRMWFLREVRYGRVSAMERERLRSGRADKGMAEKPLRVARVSWR